MKTPVDDHSDIEETLERDMDQQEEEEEESAPIVSTKKEAKPRAPKKAAGLATKKKPSKPRAAPRPYKKMSSVMLASTMETLQDRIEAADNRLKTYSIRYKKFLMETKERVLEETAVVDIE
jgi:hypothetical protein